MYFQVFDKYKEFIDLLLDLKKDTRKEDISNEIQKYDLKSQLFLIRDFSVKEDILKNNSNSTKDYNFEWKINKKLGKNIHELNLKIKSHFGSYQIKSFYIILSKEDRFILAIGYLSSKNLKRIEAFLESFFPKISNTFLTQNEIKQMIFSLTRKKKYSLEYKMIIYSKKALDGKIPRKAVDYILEDLKTKILELENEHKFIDTIELLVSEIEENNIFRFRYNRLNKLIWYKGKADEVIKILNNIYNIIIKKFDYLDKRERKDTSNNETKPFILKFNESIFSTKDQISFFINSFKNFPKCTYAVIHSGNPYLHLIMRDIKDNSSYTLKTVSHKDLMICPQIISSNSSLIRILDFISNNIFEYKILDYDIYLDEIQSIKEN